VQNRVPITKEHTICPSFFRLATRLLFCKGNQITTILGWKLKVSVGET
jgi:hypothetical protein